MPTRRDGVNAGRQSRWMLLTHKAVCSHNKRRGEVAAVIGLDVCMILRMPLLAEAHSMRPLGERCEEEEGANEPKDVVELGRKGAVGMLIRQ